MTNVTQPPSPLQALGEFDSAVIEYGLNLRKDVMDDLVSKGYQPTDLDMCDINTRFDESPVYIELEYWEAYQAKSHEVFEYAGEYSSWHQDYIREFAHVDEGEWVVGKNQLNPPRILSDEQFKENYAPTQGKGIYGLKRFYKAFINPYEKKVVVQLNQKDSSAFRGYVGGVRSVEPDSWFVDKCNEIGSRRNRQPDIRKDFKGTPLVTDIETK